MAIRTVLREQSIDNNSRVLDIWYMLHMIQSPDQVKLDVAPIVDASGLRPGPGLRFGVGFFLIGRSGGGSCCRCLCRCRIQAISLLLPWRPVEDG